MKVGHIHIVKSLFRKVLKEVLKSGRSILIDKLDIFIILLQKYHDEKRGDLFQVDKRI